MAVFAATPPRSFADFKPSSHGLAFRNSFTGSPLPRGFEGVSAMVGAPQRFGLCGGMSFAAADYFLANRQPPGAERPPTQGTPLYQYLYDRQVASLGAGLAAAPVFADRMRRRDDGILGARHLTALALPRVLAQLELGKPAILGLVHVSAADHKPIWENHQALAYRAHRRAGGAVDLLVYDPNHPHNDGVMVRCEPVVVGMVPIPGAIAVRMPVVGLKCSLRAPAMPGRPAREKVVRGFFLMPYEAVVPPEGL